MVDGGWLKFREHAVSPKGGRMLTEVALGLRLGVGSLGLRLELGLAL